MRSSVTFENSNRLKQQNKRKVRHQSANVFPDGFRVKETVKRKIMGRLRAASHACDDNQHTSNTKKNKTVVITPSQNVSRNFVLYETQPFKGTTS